MATGVTGREVCDWRSRVLAQAGSEAKWNWHQWCGYLLARGIKKDAIIVMRCRAQKVITRIHYDPRPSQLHARHERLQRCA